MNTFRDKFGRRDPDLSPQHDAIMWWLDQYLENNSYDAEVRQSLDFDNDPELFLSSVINKLPEWARDRVVEPPPSLPCAKLKTIEWEYIVPRNIEPGRLPFAFIDIMASFEVEYIGKKYLKNDQEIERPTRRIWGDSLPDWFSDRFDRITWQKYSVIQRVGFEVKPTIYSVGEVLRQLRSYKNLEPDVLQWVVVSPENSLAKKAIRGMGFGWLNAPESVA